MHEEHIEGDFTSKAENNSTCPLGHPPIRILLSRAASEALTATGERAFAIVSRAMRGTEEPETSGRWEITLAPIEWDTTRDACAVLLGHKRAAKLSTKKS